MIFLFKGFCIVNGTLKCYIWDDLPNTGLKGNKSEVAKVLGSEPGLTSSKPNHPSASCYGENYCGAVYATGSANGQSVKAGLKIQTTNFEHTKVIITELTSILPDLKDKIFQRFMDVDQDC